MSLFEKAIGWISPLRLLRRKAARVAASFIDSSYTGGSVFSRRMRSWLPVSRSADSDYDQGTQKTLVARCRDAHRNQSLARAAVDRLKHNVVGPGLRLQSHIDWEMAGITEAEATIIERLVERKFEHWCENCDFERTLKFSKMQVLTLVSMLISGDVIVNTPYRIDPGCAYGLKIQIIESDRLCNPNLEMDSRRMVRGVELDEDGAPIAYHIMSQHPGDFLLEEWTWRRYPIYGRETGRKRILLPFDKERPGQTRGVPFLAPILEPLRQLDRYTEAELTAAVVNALLTVFVKSDNPTPPLPSSSSSTTAPSTDDQIALSSGGIVNLLPNEHVDTTVQPGRPNANYDPFVLAVFKQIGAALSIPIEVLLLTFNASYSAAKGAILQAWKLVVYHRSIMIDMLCQPIYELWFDELVARGEVNIPNYADPMVRFLYTRASWVGPTRGALDENKEVLAAQDRVNMGISSLQIEAEELQGVDWLDIHKQRAIEKKMRVEAGLEAPLKDETKNSQQPIGTNSDGNTENQPVRDTATV